MNLEKLLDGAMRNDKLGTKVVRGDRKVKSHFVVTIGSKKPLRTKEIDDFEFLKLSHERGLVENEEAKGTISQW